MYPRTSSTLVAALLVAACGGSTSTATQHAVNTGPASTATQTAVTKGPAVNTGPAPWPNPNHVQARVAAAGLPGGISESTFVHYHAHLDIFVNGHSEPVAPSIARQDGYVFSPLHTHANSGMIHIEASRNQRFTLGMLFTEWGVRLTDDCVGGYCRPGTPVSAYVDGQPTTEPMPDIVFRKGEEIALVIGSPPSPIPSTWDCRAKISPIENPDDCKNFGQ
jgi:hypothetical protein